jgi:hypothetical protein
MLFTTENLMFGFFLEMLDIKRSSVHFQRVQRNIVIPWQ